MINLPDKYLNKMKELLQDEYDDYLESFNKPVANILRINTLKISVDDFLKVSPFNLEPVLWNDDCFYYQEDDEPSKHPYYYAGLYYLQEASASLPASILPIEENDYVLDGCSAPGGKAFKIGCKLNGSGLLIANDISSSRCHGLLRNIERSGIKNCFVTSNDIKEFEKDFSLFFDKIIIDAPCSGEGMFRKEPSLIKSWIEKGNDYYTPIQKEIITSAYKLLKEGGIMVYSTCTFDPKEDEEIIRFLLDNNHDAKLLPIRMYEGFKKGKDNIGVKLFPHKVRGEGHFVCLISKGDIKNNNRDFKKYCLKDNHLNMAYRDCEVRSFNGKNYLVPNIDLKRLRILRSGLLLSEIKNDKTSYLQPLAMALKINEFDKTINLDVNDNRVIKYLKGETIDVKDYCLEGQVLICVNNYPLGFGKIDKGLFKNKIDKGWIYR